MECESYMSAQYHFAVPRQEGTIGYFRSSYQKLSSFVSDLLGASARRMLKALAEGETNPAALAALADRNLRATPEQLCDVRLAPGTQSSHWGHRPSTVSANLVDPASGSPLRRTGPSGHQTIEATPHLQDDSATPKARLSDRTTEPSTEPSTSAVTFEPVDKDLFCFNGRWCSTRSPQAVRGQPDECLTPPNTASRVGYISRPSKFSWRRVSLVAPDLCTIIF